MCDSVDSIYFHLTRLVDYWRWYSWNPIDQGFWIGWLSYEAGSWIEPNNSWRESEMATLWIASYDPIIKFNTLKKEIIIEGTNLNDIKEYTKDENLIDLCTVITRSRRQCTKTAMS